MQLRCQLSDAVRFTDVHRAPGKVDSKQIGRGTAYGKRRKIYPAARGVHMSTPVGESDRP